LENLAPTAGWTEDFIKAEFLDGQKLHLRQALISSSRQDNTLQEHIEEVTRIDNSSYAVQAKYRTGRGGLGIT
jgi:ATP/maltotriose-dependent transcriptional regulator MalT